MTIKDRLQNFQQQSIEMNQLQNRILTLRDRMYSIKSSSDMSMIPTGGGNTDKIGELISNISELESIYIDKLNSLIDEEKEIERMIEWLQPVERLLIRSRYIEGNTWEDICGIIGYSWRQTHRLHANALANLENVAQYGTLISGIMVL